LIGASEIHDFLNELFKDLFMRDDIVLTPETTAPDIEGWDSYKQVDIIIATEDKYGIKMSTREIDGLASIVDLVRLIEAKTAGDCPEPEIPNKSTGEQ
jgi:acyl carrier protein